MNSADRTVNVLNTRGTRTYPWLECDFLSGIACPTVPGSTQHRHVRKCGCSKPKPMGKKNTVRSAQVWTSTSSFGHLTASANHPLTPPCPHPGTPSPPLPLTPSPPHPLTPSPPALLALWAGQKQCFGRPAPVCLWLSRAWEERVCHMARMSNTPRENQHLVVSLAYLL